MILIVLQGCSLAKLAQLKKALYHNLIVFREEVMPKIALIFRIIDGLSCHNFQVEVLALTRDVRGEVP